MEHIDMWCNPCQQNELNGKCDACRVLPKCNCSTNVAIGEHNHVGVMNFAAMAQTRLGHVNTHAMHVDRARTSHKRLLREDVAVAELFGHIVEHVHDGGVLKMSIDIDRRSFQ